MANPKIEVEIGAVTDGLIRGLDGSILSLKQLTAEAKKIEIALETATDVKSINTYNSQLANLKNGMQRLKSTGIDPLTRATSTYNGVGIEFSRIIQDAPFGIIGVGNNITQLASQFQTLGKAGDSVGTKLGLALSSIVSPANLVVLGISAVTTALTLYSMGAFDSKDSTEELIKEVDRLSEASAEYVKTLNAVNSSQLKGSQNATVEIASLRTLYTTTQDTTLSLVQRQKAVDALQEKYPNVFKNIKDETILNGGAKKSYDDLTTSILANAKAKAAESTLVDNEKKLLALQNERESVNQKISESEKRSTLELKDQVAVFGQFKNLAQQQAESETRIVEPSLIRRAELAKEINKLTSDNLKLVDQIGVENSNVVVELGKEVEKTKELKRVLEDISKLPIIGLPKVGDVEVLRKRFEELRSGGIETGTPQQQLDQAVSNAPGVQTDPTAQMIESMRAGREVLANSYAEMKAQAEQFNQDISDIINNGAANTLGNFAFSIGDALASGGDVLKAAGASLLDGLASVLNQLGQLAIATGIGIKGIKTALKTLNPAVAIGAGVALVALAGFVSSKAKSLGGGPSSEGSGGGGSVGGGVASQSFTGTGLGALTSNELVGEFTVKGSDLVFVLSQEEKKRNKG